MNLRAARLGLVIAMVLLATPTAALCQHAKRDRAADLLTTLKRGQWILLVGRAQKDSSVLCTEVKLLTGDFLDDDWNLTGTVSSVDGRKREFTVGPIRIHPAENADFDSPRGTIKGLSDLRPGMIVDVDGTYMKDRLFLAKEVDDESGELNRKLGTEKHIQIMAKIERVDPAKRRIFAMGTMFQVTPQTQLKSVIR
jgi:hypothetical protein